MSLVINSLRSEHTHTRTHNTLWMKANFKKPGTAASRPGLKIFTPKLFATEVVYTCL